MAKPTICICGGGALGHTIAGVIASKEVMNVVLLTSTPQLWSEVLEIHDCYSRTFKGRLKQISNNAADVIPTSDIILLCLPGYLIADKLNEIKPYLNGRQHIGSVVSSTGFFFMAKDIFGPKNKLFGFQRVPFIARIEQYGHTAALLGYKKQLKLATINIENESNLLSYMEQAFTCPIKKLHHYLDAALSNSNPILHTTRLFNLFEHYHIGQTYDREYLFYEEWNDDTSELLIQCDSEFQQIVEQLPADVQEIPPLLEYYECKDSHSLTKKIRSIQAFKGLKAPLIPSDEPCGFVPDLQNRYFTEDFPYGLYILKRISQHLDIKTPYIDKVLAWGKDLLGDEIFNRSYFNPNNKIIL